LAPGFAPEGSGIPGIARGVWRCYVVRGAAHRQFRGVRTSQIGGASAAANALLDLYGRGGTRVCPRRKPKDACNLAYLRFLNSPIARGEESNAARFGDIALCCWSLRLHGDTGNKPISDRQFNIEPRSAPRRTRRSRRGTWDNKYRFARRRASRWRIFHSVAFGSIFGSVYGPTGVASGSAASSSFSMSGEGEGQASIFGNRGTTMQCEFLNQNMTGHGYGACRTPKGVTYRMIY